ncbi:MAG: hypothetical protein IKQ84_08250, partial [Spirochaetaceae bacterium]|nr:hypothetical protein [Spirochaetaceae bacterium]
YRLAEGSDLRTRTASWLAMRVVRRTRKTDFRQDMYMNFQARLSGVQKLILRKRLNLAHRCQFYLRKTGN